MKSGRSLHKIAYLFLTVLLVILLTGCGQARQTQIERVIGVSLVNLTDEWRLELKEELETEAAKYPGLKLIFLDAGGDTEKQKNDLDDLIGFGAELLIVSPNDANELMSSVEKIYYNGTPILLLDRTVKGFDYTCFFGTDDRLLVEKEIEAIPVLTGKKPEEGICVLNIVIDNYTGTQRAELFKSALPERAEVRQLVTDNGTKDETEDIIMENRDMLDGVDMILTQNDYMASGASAALDRLKQRSGIKILGADGFSGENGGIEMVQKGTIDGTIVCPAGGKEAVDYAMNYFGGLLDGPKQVIVRNSLVTKDTVEDYLRENGQIKKRKIDSIGYVQISEETGFRKANTESYAEAAMEYGKDLEIKECKTREEQFEAFRKFVKDGKDAIIVSPIVEDGWEEVFSLAKQADIPVILSDREVSAGDDLYTLFVGADFAEEGARCMRWMGDNMKDYKRVRILEIAGTSGSSPAIGRGKGFRDTMEEKNWKYKIVASLNGDFSREEGNRVMKEYLLENGVDFDVIFCHNDDMMLGAVSALKEAGISPGEDIKVLSIDGTIEALHTLENHEANFVAECTPLLGPDAMRALENIENGEETPLKIISSEGSFDDSITNVSMLGRKY